MKRFLGILSMLFALVCISTTALADNTLRFKTARTGGGASALDGINGSSLADGDLTFVTESDRSFVYVNDATCSDAENDPLVILPDTNPGTNCWNLKGVMSGVSAVAGGTTPYVISSLNSSSVELRVSDPTSSAQIDISGSTGFGRLTFYTQNTLRASLLAYEPNGTTGNSLFQIQNAMNNGQTQITANDTSGTVKYLNFYGSNGSLQLYTSGTSLFFGTGTAAISEYAPTGTLWAWNDAGTGTTITSHSPDTNYFELDSTNVITGERQRIEIERFFRDAVAGKFASGIAPQDAAKYIHLTQADQPEVVRARLEAKEALEREAWKEQYIQRNTIAVKGMNGKEFYIRPSLTEADAAATKDFIPHRPNWLKERAGLQ